MNKDFFEMNSNTCIVVVFIGLFIIGIVMVIDKL